MTERERKEQNGGLMNRRTVLKGAAAAGFAATAPTVSASADGYHQIKFCAPDDEDYFEYGVQVSGEIVSGGNTDDGDELLEDGTVVEGAVGEGRCDTWKFKGESLSLELHGRGKVYVNGELVKDTTEKDVDEG